MKYFVSVLVLIAAIGLLALGNVNLAEWWGIPLEFFGLVLIILSFVIPSLFEKSSRSYREE